MPHPSDLKELSFRERVHALATELFNAESSMHLWVMIEKWRTHLTAAGCLPLFDRVRELAERDMVLSITNLHDRDPKKNNLRSILDPTLLEHQSPVRTDLHPALSGLVNRSGHPLQGTDLARGASAALIQSLPSDTDDDALRQFFERRHHFDAHSAVRVPNAGLGVTTSDDAIQQLLERARAVLRVLAQLSNPPFDLSSLGEPRDAAAAIPELLKRLESADDGDLDE